MGKMVKYFNVTMPFVRFVSDETAVILNEHGKEIYVDVKKLDFGGLPDEQVFQIGETVYLGREPYTFEGYSYHRNHATISKNVGGTTNIFTKTVEVTEISRELPPPPTTIIPLEEGAYVNYKGNTYRVATERGDVPVFVYEGAWI